jgi:hypothetical protein
VRGVKPLHPDFYRKSIAAGQNQRSREKVSFVQLVGIEFLGYIQSVI